MQQMVRPRNESLDLIASKGLYNKGGDRAEELPDDYDDLIGSTCGYLHISGLEAYARGTKKYEFIRIIAFRGLKSFIIFG
jgi:hypothetical protein